MRTRLSVTFMLALPLFLWMLSQGSQSNVKVFIVTREVQQRVLSALFTNYKIFRTDVYNNKIFGKKLQNIKCVQIFYTTFETFVI